MDFIAQLMVEHQDYVLKLATLAEVIEGVRVSGRGEYFIDALDELLRPLTTDLDDHARREEEFLFPRLLDRVPDSPIPIMLAEHQAIREQSAQFGHWYSLWRAGDDDVYPKWADNGLDLRGKFSAHMQKENLILFPLARRVLSESEIKQLSSLGDR